MIDDLFVVFVDISVAITIVVTVSSSISMIKGPSEIKGPF